MTFFLFFCLSVFDDCLFRHQDGHYKEVYGIAFQAVSTLGGAGGRGDCACMRMLTSQAYVRETDYRRAALLT